MTSHFPELKTPDSTILTIEMIAHFEKINILTKYMNAEANQFYAPLGRMLKEINGNDHLDSLKTKVNQNRKTSIIEEMINAIQFHDIIKQKTENILKLHDYLIMELKQQANGKIVGKQNYVPMLSSIVKMNMAQLELIRDEFIQSKATLHAGMTESGLLFPKALIKNSNHVIAAIGDQIEKIKEIVSAQPSSTKRFLKEELEHIQRLFVMESERKIFYRIFGIRPPAEVQNAIVNDMELF